ncbi:hypothetical protein GYMLUDRAFT_247516 [Collybiopsis luxurians FD-317 M1]|uniref:Uncharacterized protein n=1 Tax=Collybiopsis luxurians FD-317 M1 TaxID=944289 RepID=A0A0D0BNW8_9AGAR|nr:hypothetical protein GYMLUDRAFT_247516 [Collybiopsis luxurians FD-317 M1]
MNEYHPIVSTHQDPARVPAEQYWRSGTQEYRPYIAELTYDYSNHASTYRGYGVAGAPGGPPYGGVTQTGGISDGNLKRERGSRNGSFRGGSGGGGSGGPRGPGGPGSPGGPPNNPDDWGLNHNTYWHPANGWVANYPQWVQRFQELDNSICATNAAHSHGGNSGFGMYNPMAPSNPQNSNPQQGSNNNNPQQAGGQQGRNQGNWTNQQRGAAAWDSNVNLDNISGTVYGQSEDFASGSNQNGNSGEGLENQGGNNRVLKNPGDKEFLWAI